MQLELNERNYCEIINKKSLAKQGWAMMKHKEFRRESGISDEIGSLEF